MKKLIASLLSLIDLVVYSFVKEFKKVNSLTSAIKFLGFVVISPIWLPIALIVACYMVWPLAKAISKK